VRRFLLLVALLVVGAVVGVPSGGSAPDNRDPLATALNYIRENRERLGLTAADVTEMAVTDRYRDAHNGVTHIGGTAQHHERRTAPHGTEPARPPSRREGSVRLTNVLTSLPRSGGRTGTGRDRPPQTGRFSR
jgi:hypothetical protein